MYDTKVIRDPFCTSGRICYRGDGDFKRRHRASKVGKWRKFNPVADDDEDGEDDSAEIQNANEDNAGDAVELRDNDVWDLPFYECSPCALVWGTREERICKASGTIRPVSTQFRYIKRLKWVSHVSEGGTEDPLPRDWSKIVYCSELIILLHDCSESAATAWSILFMVHYTRTAGI